MRIIFITSAPYLNEKKVKKHLESQLPYLDLRIRAAGDEQAVILDQHQVPHFGHMTGQRFKAMLSRQVPKLDMRVLMIWKDVRKFLLISLKTNIASDITEDKNTMLDGKNKDKNRHRVSVMT